MKIVELDHPKLLTEAPAQGVLPFINSCLILFPGNTQNGGIWWPRAFPHPMTVIVEPFPDATAGGAFDDAEATMYDYYFNPFSSTL